MIDLYSGILTMAWLANHSPMGHTFSTKFGIQIVTVFQICFQTPEQENSPGLPNVSIVASMLPNVSSNASLPTPDDVEPDSLAASTPGICLFFVKCECE